MLVVIVGFITGCDSPQGNTASVESKKTELASLELIDFRGVLDERAANAIGLDEADRATLQSVIDGQRVVWSEVILESIRKRHDEYGNLLIEIPDARREGKVFRSRLFDAIQKKFGSPISAHFDELIEEKELSGMLRSLSEDWFYFGEPVIYIVRGGENDERRDEIPPGELWIQFVEGWDTIKGGYETSIYILPYEGLPRQLQELMSQSEVEPFVGSEIPSAEQNASEQPATRLQSKSK